MAGDTTITDAAAGPYAGSAYPHSASGMAGNRPVTTILLPEGY